MKFKLYQGYTNKSERTPDIINKIEQFPEGILKKLREIAKPVSEHERVDTTVTKQTLLSLCEEYSLSLPVLAELLNRSEDSLRKNFLNQMVGDNSLDRAYPQTPNHPKQAYKTRLSL